MMATKLFCALLFSVCKFQADGGSIVVNTTSGWYKGKMIEMNNQLVYAFLNVTYGQPPIGPNRFRPPQAAPHSNGIIQADRPAQACYQKIDTTYPGFQGTEMWNPEGGMTESCLTLNIWTPANAHNAPVIVWIFGGGFSTGSPSLYLYNGSTMAAYSGIVVVNINYRLNVFGFFYMNDTEAPPNVGLLDQRLALEWVQKNIAGFGGDPSQVTLMGESAGAASVMAHLHAVKSWPLFKYAIVQSGAVTLPWANVEKSDLLKHSIMFAHQLNCNGSRSQMLDCLREQSPTKILSTTENVWSSSFLHSYFVPVLRDELFFGKEGYENVLQGVTKNTSVLLGYNEDEGSFWLPTCLAQFFNITSEETTDLPEMAELVNLTFSFLTEKQRSYATDYYRSETNDVRGMLSSMVGDYYFTCGILDLAESLAQHNIPVYLFNFNYRSESNPWPQWMGVMHGYEIEFIFGGPLNRKGEQHEEDVRMSKMMMEYSNSFIRHGMPFAISPGAAHWPAYTQDNRAYTSFSSDGAVLKLKPLRDSCDMFKRLQSGDLSSTDSGQRQAFQSPFLIICIPMTWMNLRTIIS
uniref:Carboxylic ester hydrolase n=1 Tax=Trichuris muris TaxID=70415 RepID=A0A5S6R1W5_TRIMR